MAFTIRNNLTFDPHTKLTLPADSPEVAALAGHLRAGRCALFVGAGLSAPAGLPTWGNLMDRIVAEATPWAVDPALFDKPIDMEEPATRELREPPIAAIRAAVGEPEFALLCRRVGAAMNRRFDLQVLDQALGVVYYDSIDRMELQKLAAQKRFAELAGECRDVLGHMRFARFIRHALTPLHDLPATHRDIVRTPYSCVVTTNFDTLLEDAYARYGTAGIPRAPTGAELGQQGTLLLDRAFFVLKAHGDAARPETMVFTADDYRRVIHANPAFQAVLSGILLTHAVLFVGYSLSDTNFRLLLDNQLTIFNGNVPPRYAIMSGVGPAECDILWKTAKLRVLPYPDGQHGELARCLTALADQSSTRGLVSRKTSGRGSQAGTYRQRPYATLAIEGDGDRLSIELVQRHANGQVERLWLGGAARPDSRVLGVALRAADAAQGLDHSPLPHVRTVGSRLTRSLPMGLARALAALPKGSLVEIWCSPAVTRIPWEWLMVSGQPLAALHAVLRHPVEITHQARGWRAVNRPLRALVFGDAGSGDGTGERYARLEYADLEAATIEHLLRAQVAGSKVTRLSRETATHARVLSELDRGDYDVIHFGGHAWFDDREAYFLLWDRIMLGSELAPLLSRRPPALMVLDTHYTAFVLAEVDAQTRELVGSPNENRPNPPTSATRGFAEAAMRCGVTSFVGTFGNIMDYSGAEFSVTFFANLLLGSTVAEALRLARKQTAVSTHDSGLLYTVFGYPDFCLIEDSLCGRRSSARAMAAAKSAVGWPSRPKPTR